jgi:uncharacterized membrane protein YgdD (TMEM256/DUF423 family)
MWWRIGAILGGLGVALGAFGAHGLKQIIDDPHRLDVWETAARYQMIHALALCAVAAHPRAPRGPAWLFLVGTFIFSGSLYALALSGIGILGAITPMGGACFIAGWIWLAFTPTRRPPA